MHPFSLNDEEIKQVGGADYTPILPIFTSVYKESGVEPPPDTTLALGEEGGLPPDSLA